MRVLDTWGEQRLAKFPTAPTCVQALARYDMIPICMDSAQCAKFAQETFAREKALAEKLGLFKAQ